MKTLWISAALVAAGLLCARPAAAQIGVVSVTGGRAEGVSADGVTSFKGIPFAAPPVGNLRWRAPQPVRPWSGIRRADHFGPRCMQDPNRAARLGAPPTPMSEDCLYLNVWTPAKSPHERLPVMVWIYGGAYVLGTTSRPLYDGAQLAKRGVVVVSIAYRLGAFGFLADPELSAESPRHVSGNYGLRDMIAGLKWVRSNIARFGGDPVSVTIFGQSAGGAAVSMLAQSPLAEGLFQRAISESGANFAPPKRANEWYPGAPAYRPLSFAEAAGQRFLVKLGARDIAAARALPANVIQQAVSSGPSHEFVPIFDGVVLPDDGFDLYEAGRFNDTPVLIGTNADEGGFFAPAATTSAQFEGLVRAAFGPYANYILTAYPHSTNAQATQASRDVLRDLLFAWSTSKWALLQSEKGRRRAYLYLFDHRTPWFPLGPVHTAELPYVFGNFGAPLFARPVGAPRPADLTLSELIQSYWVNFAKTGNPNGSGLPHWPAFNASSQRVMYLDTHSHAGPVPNLKKLKALDAYFAWLRKEAK